MPLTFILSLLLILPARLRAAPADLPLPKDTFLIPFSDKVTAGWLLDKTLQGGCRLLPDPKAAPWLLCREHFLLGLFYERMFTINMPVNDAVWLDNGAVFSVSGGQLAILPLPRELQKKPAAALELLKPEFVKFFTLETMRLAAAGPESLYVYGHDGKTGKTQIFLLQFRGKSWEAVPLTATTEKVTAVAGDGKYTFAAIGREVIRLTAPEKKYGAAPPAKKIFKHSFAELTGLDYSPELGLFYATENGAGFIGERYNFEFLSSPETQIKLKGGSMLVLLSRERGVLRLDGLNVFKERDDKLRAAEAKNTSAGKNGAAAGKAVKW